jgi:hypothetical protein
VAELTDEQRERLQMATGHSGIFVRDVIAPVVADLLAAERERIAQVIEAHGNVEERKPFTPYSSGKFDGLHAAARIVREVPDDH